MVIMKKIIAVLLAMTLVPISSVFAEQVDKGDKVTLIVELSGDAVLETKQAAEMGAKLFSETDEAQELESKIRSEQAHVMSDIEKKIDSEAEIGFTYTHILNGFSIEGYESDIEKIKALPDVENVYISRNYELRENTDTESGGMYLDSGCEMMKTDYMHDNGITGQGAVIAVIDSGFDVSHENFQGEITGAKLSKADIAEIIDRESLSINASGGDVTVNRVYRSEKIPYAYNYDNKNSDTFNASEPHGMHVAGIAAGNNGTDPLGNKFVGTAPDAQLLLMACPNLSTAATIAATDDAVKLGSDVINASYGEYYVEMEELTEKAINNAASAGVIFSAAAGNASRGYEANPVNAANIDYSTSGSPDGISASTSVASANNTDIWGTYNTMYVGEEEIKFAEENKSASFAQAFSDGEYEYVYVGTGMAEEFAGADVQNKIALMDRGQGLSFALRITNAKNAGAAGVVCINSEDIIGINIVQASLQDMPTVSVLPSDGEKLKTASVKKLRSGTETKSERIHSDNVSMSSFSSWGVNSSLELKPEITAPGGYIYSSVNDDKYENMSGTSMAAPHLTGAVALLKQYIRANPEKYGEPQGTAMMTLTENLLMTGADVLIQNKENNIPYSPRLQGAGMVNLEKAAKTPVTLIGGEYGKGENVYEKSKISLGEIDTNEFALTFKARNLTDEPVTYDKLNMIVMTDSADENGIVGDMTTFTFMSDLPESVTVPANEDKEITVKVTIDQDELDENMKTFINGFFVDGYVFMGTADDSLLEISIPFTGFYGDWSSAPALDKPMYSGGLIPDGTYIDSYTYMRASGLYANAKAAFALGKNLFVGADNADYNDYCSEDFVGISPNGDGEFDNLRGIITPLRQLGKTDFYIYDSEGKVIAAQTDISSATGEFYYAKKFDESALNFGSSTVNALDDGDYTFRVESGFYGQKEYSQNESVEMKFYVDRTTPVIEKCETREDGDKTYLDVAATDNRHLMGIIVFGTNFCEVYPIKGTQSAEHTFDITGVDLASLSVEVVDYAMNSKKITATGLDILYQGKSNSSFMFSIYNTSGATINAAFTAALYRDGALVGINSKNMNVCEGEMLESFTIPNTGYDTIKIFVWNNLDEMVPLYSAFEF